jgi:hypothetical protein
MELPNVYRQPGKELCDNLVVFRNHVIIFSDKSCQYPETGDELLDWTRWFKRAVERSADQVHGAERWIRNSPERLFVDAKCIQPFPLKLPPPRDTQFHRVIVVLNASARCRKHFNNGGTGEYPERPMEMPAAMPRPPEATGNRKQRRAKKAAARRLAK